MRLGIKGKIVGAFGVMVLAMVLVSGVIYYQINGMERTSSLALEKTKTIEFLVRKEVDHLSWLNGLANALLLNQEFKGQLNHELCAFGKWYYGIIRGNDFKDFSPELQKALLALEEPHEKLHKSAQRINVLWKTLPRQQGNQETLAIYQNETQQYIGEIRKGLAQVEELLAKEQVVLLAEVAAQGKTILKTMLGVLGVMLVCLFFGVWIANRIARPITQMAEVAEEIARGNLTVEIVDCDTKDETHRLCEVFQAMVKTLKEIMSNVVQASGQVLVSSGKLTVSAQSTAAATSQVARAMEELAEGNSKQTNNIRQTAQTMEQLTLAIEQIAAGAQEQARSVTDTNAQVDWMVRKISDVVERAEYIKSASQQSYETAQEGGKAVEATIQEMHLVKAAVFDSADKMTKLGEQSQQIGEIIEVIDEIAEQTNLLALNAAIEAARAGEHGKGFAVVADEVRKLAERSGKATKEIANLVMIIQKGTEVAVKSMEVGTNQVEKGVGTAQSAGRALTEIVQMVNQSGTEIQAVVASMEEINISSQEVQKSTTNVAAIVEQNSAATEQMAAGSREVSTAVNDMSHIVQESSVATQQVSTSMEEVNASAMEIVDAAQALQTMADKLRNIVSCFKLG
ncbi:MAG: methyl-accepting chemotaxis protein [Carboxydocellales bacterium]